MSRPLHPPPCLNCAAPSKTTQNRPGNALASLVPLNLLGDPPKRLKPVDKAAWREMQEHGFWLTSADQFMVEIAASLMAKQRGGTIDNPARRLLVGTLSKLGSGRPSDRR